uniref:Uncharacterized protein n=1 Tax=Oryza meridionalis TaxID=40149 RepID=A0A0E0CPL0_9ORYZ
MADLMLLKEKPIHSHRSPHLCNNWKKVEKVHRRGFDTVATLLVWTIWKERKKFGVQPTTKIWHEVTKTMTADAALWRLANELVPRARSLAAKIGL